MYENKKTSESCKYIYVFLKFSIMNMTEFRPLAGRTIVLLILVSLYAYNCFVKSEL